MKDEDFRQMRDDLRMHLCASVKQFMEERGITYDFDAYREQAMVKTEDLLNDILYLGANVFPRSVKQETERTEERLSN